MASSALIGPFDRIFRVIIGTMLLIITYTLHLTSTWFAMMHVAAIYLWVTTMVVWDPAYAMIFKFIEVYREYKLMRGDF